MRPVTKPTPPRIAEIAEAAQKLDELTVMRLMLQDTIGYYCSFCEMPITVNQAVASKRARELTRTPKLADWSDLLLACDYCQLHRTADVTDLSAYLWPDTDATFSLAGTSPFVYTRQDVTYIVIDEEGKRVTTTRQMVIVSANTISTKHDQAQRTIDLFQLNSPFYNAQTNTYTITNADLQAQVDPRVDLRTAGWALADYTVSTLRQAQTLSSAVFFESIVQLSAILAQATGFWSGWMLTLWSAFADARLVQRILLEIREREGYQVVGFQTVPDGGTPPWTIFTGTAVNRLQL
jgi:hypothetical protein